MKLFPEFIGMTIVPPITRVPIKFSILAWKLLCWLSYCRLLWVIWLNCRRILDTRGEAMKTLNCGCGSGTFGILCGLTPNDSYVPGWLRICRKQPACKTVSMTFSNRWTIWLLLSDVILLSVASILRHRVLVACLLPLTGLRSVLNSWISNRMTLARVTSILTTHRVENGDLTRWVHLI